MLKPPVQSRGQGQGAGLGGGRGWSPPGLQPSTSQTGEERRRGRDKGESGGATSAAEESSAATSATLHHEWGHWVSERGVPQEVPAQRPQGQQRADLDPRGDEVPEPGQEHQHPGLAVGGPARVLSAGLDTVPAPHHPGGAGELREERVARKPYSRAEARVRGEPWSRVSADVRHWQHSIPRGHQASEATDHIIIGAQ